MFTGSVNPSLFMDTTDACLLPLPKKFLEGLSIIQPGACMLDAFKETVSTAANSASYCSPNCSIKNTQF